MLNVSEVRWLTDFDFIYLSKTSRALLLRKWRVVTINRKDIYL